MGSSNTKTNTELRDIENEPIRTECVENDRNTKSQNGTIDPYNEEILPNHPTNPTQQHIQIINHNN